MSTIKQKEQGFTLVELSIVLIIVGLLIGGILKGQELIANARIASTLQQIKAIDAGTNGFLDAYGYLPGDLAQADQKLPNCPVGSICGATAAIGTGTAPGGFLADGVIGDVTTTNLGLEIDEGTDDGAERAAAFVQLTAADFIGGIDPNAADNTVFGRANPASSIPGGGFRIGYTRDGGAELLTRTAANADLRRGHYLELATDPAEAIDDADLDTFLTASQAARMDRKLDDGLPNLGSVRAFGDSTATDGSECSDGADDDSIYVEANTSGVCGLYIQTAG